MVKVRFAPSPTGYLHVGNLRTAIANYLLARNRGGSFVLRIEDTDMERSDEAYTQSIMDDLKWLGIPWDEGPYRQSERTGIYREHIALLMKKGLAYKCFCSRERLEKMRSVSLGKGEPPRYDGACRNLSPEEILKREQAGEPYVIRFRSLKEAIRIKDLIHGEIHFPGDHVDDFILMKQELTPSYNFAVTVDDMLMGITHVVRGSDHISNTPKQVMLFKAFGRTPPKYGHHSLLTGPDNKPLSKRHGATQVREFREMGILPRALVNYVGIIGRNVGKEIMDEEELVETFTVGSLSPSDSLFDMGKLLWINKEYLRKTPTESLLGELGIPAGRRDEVDLLKENSRTLAELRGFLDIFDGADIGEEGLIYLSGIPDLAAAVSSVSALAGNGMLSLDEMVTGLETSTSLKKRDRFMLLRVMLTGRKDGPPLKDVLPLIKKDVIAERMSFLKKHFSLP